jgi:hypothetical protein
MRNARTAGTRIRQGAESEIRQIPAGECAVSESPARRRLLTARGNPPRNELDYGAAGLTAAAGLATSLVTALAAALAASLAIGAAADAAASGAAGAVSSDLLQAVAKNIEISASSRTLRIAFSLIARRSIERRDSKRANNTIGAG